MTDLRSLRTIWWACGFIAAYVILDLLCGPPARHWTINPVWHPAGGLALFAVLRGGRRMIAPLLVAALFAALAMPIVTGRLGLSIGLGMLPLISYISIAWLIRRYLPANAFFTSHRGVLLLTSFVTGGSLFSGALYASLLSASGALVAPSWLEAMIRYSIAETAGMLVVMPLAWCLSEPEVRTAFLARVLKWETAAYTVLIGLILWVALQRPVGESLAYYLLFLPLAWAAARQGMAGAISAAIILEAGVTAAAVGAGSYSTQMPDLQMLVLTLTLSGFLIGVAVDVAQRASEELRQSLRLAAAGEMAAALAHELNQPLTALSAYGSACMRLAEHDDDGALLRKTLQSMVGESQRASNVMKRLRDFFRTGSTTLERVPLPELIKVATGPFGERARNEQILFEIGDVPPVILLVDRVQIEIVLRNLLANAFDAVTEHDGSTERRVTIEAGADHTSIWIRVADNGPGIANKVRARLFEPFVSTKSSGLGLGLAISRSIVETHGGTLVIEPSKHGILVIRLPAGSIEKEAL